MELAHSNVGQTTALEASCLMDTYQIVKFHLSKPSDLFAVAYVLCVRCSHHLY